MAKGGASDKAKKVNVFKFRAGERNKFEVEEIKSLDERIASGAPASGTNPLAKETVAPGSYAGARKFEELPLSNFTRKALKEAKFTQMTAVQRATLPHSLCGRDILGAAKTGSGKTLSFLVPLLERLYRLRWTRMDGLGALVISPTRELALQIFDELIKIGKHHALSAGLLIGGKEVKEEAKRVYGMNILVCTPGRLLQHMDENPEFDCTNLQVLVLDEADRILDMGFSKALNAIVDNLPSKRQTMLFSATQTRSVKDLARLSLRDPEFLAVHADSAAATPLKLQQVYATVQASEKMDVLWSFIRTHLKCKVIVFLSSCKQVRFVHEALRRLRPGIPLRCLHGKMKQMKRMAVYYEFNEAKAMVLLATDIASRGLDFASVDWVVQLDCPEDAAQYIHRAGRTARLNHGGRALLTLLPSETPGFTKRLEEAKIPIKMTKLNPSKRTPVTPSLQALLSKDVELKEMAQRALVSYIKTIHFMKDKDVFNLEAIDLAELAMSMGLASVPRLRFLKGAARDGMAEGEDRFDGGEESDSDEEEEGKGKDKGGVSDSDSDVSDEELIRQMEARRAGGKTAGTSGAAPKDKEKDKAGKGKEGAAAAAAAPKAAEEDAEGDEFMVVKRRDVFETAEDEDDSLPHTSLAQAKKKKKKLKIDPHKVSGSKTVFDDEGEAQDPFHLLARNHDFGAAGDAGGAEGTEGGAALSSHHGLDAGIHEDPKARFQVLRDELRRRDRQDKDFEREKRRQKRLERKIKDRARAEEEGAEQVAVLGGASDGEGEDGSDGPSRGSSDSEGPSGSEGWGRGGGSGSEGDDGAEIDLDSDSEGEDGRPTRGAARLPEGAHFGMSGKRKAESSDEDEAEEEEDRPASGKAKGGKASGPAVRPRKQPRKEDLAAQEALALQLLSKRR